MKKRLLLGVLISALVIIGFTSCNQPTNQIVVYPPSLLDLKFVNETIDDDNYSTVTGTTRIKYGKKYDLLISFSDLDMNTNELHVSLDNFTEDDTSYKIDQKFVNQISWWNKGIYITGSKEGRATVYAYVKDKFGLTSAVQKYNITLTN